MKIVTDKAKSSMTRVVSLVVSEMGLRGYLLKRSINTVILVLFVIVLNFTIFELLPGTQAAIANLTQNPKVHDTRVIHHLQIAYGICKGFTPAGDCIPTTFLERFLAYFKSMVTFDFGNSYSSGKPILDEMIHEGRLYNTLMLLGVSTTFSILIGVFLGVLSASKRGSLFDNGSVIVSLITYSLPTFWMGLLAILIFAQTLGWFPPGGVTPATPQWILSPPPLLTRIVVRIQYLFLPAAVLTLFFYGGHLLITRATMMESLGEDYIVTAKAKGVSNWGVLFKHALKNASLPIVTNAALSFGGLLGGAIITETVFFWDGLGLWIFNAINNKDFPVMQAMFYIIALCVIGANLISDIVYGIIDPRIKYE